jgi:hypothetical protein
LKQGAVGNPVDTMKADFDKAIAPLDQDLADWVQMSMIGSEGFEFLAGNRLVLDPNFSASNEGKKLGHCYFYVDAASITLATKGDIVNNVSCRLERSSVSGSETTLLRTVATATAPTQAIDTHFTKQQFTKTIQLTPNDASNTNFSYKTKARMDTIYYNKDVYGNAINVVVADSKVTIGDSGTGTFSRVIISNKNEMALNITGDMPARTNKAGVKITDKETWNVNYLSVLEADKATLKYALSGEIVSYKNSVKSGAVNILPGSFIRAIPAANEAYLVAEGLKEINLAVVVTGIDSKVAGTLVLNNFTANKNSDYVPADLKFTGSLSNGANEFFNGTLTAKVTNFADYNSDLSNSPTNFLKGNASFVGILRIANRPDLKLSISGAQNAYNAGSFSGQYEDGANTILISATDASPKVINIASANGVSVQFKEDVNVADVMKNTSKVGSFDRQTGIVTYTDGSFESIK